MDNFINADLEFEDKSLNSLVNCLRYCYDKNQTNFAKTCFTIYSIWNYCKYNYWKAKNNEYYNSYKLLAKFGFDKNAVSRYKCAFEHYVQGTAFENVSIKTFYFGFSPSKLFEMLVLSSETLDNAIDSKLITPEMTVKEIREIIKTIKNGTDNAEKVLEDSGKTEINEEEIPMAYDPKQEYEFSYFESKTKNQLLNIVWELQKAYQKLKSSKKNIK